MKGYKKLILALAAIIVFIPAFAQEKFQEQTGTRVGMADTMRSEGRIYVVVAVMLTILIGLILYIVRIDKKLSKWEKSEGKGL